MNSEVDEINWEDLKAAASVYDSLIPKQKGTFTKPQSGETNGTSFFNVEFIATVDEITEAFGLPDWDDNDGEDKVNFSWDLKTPDGIIFTIYDWKHYRPLDSNEDISWHIGAHDRNQSNKAWSQVVRALRP